MGEERTAKRRQSSGEGVTQWQQPGGRQVVVDCLEWLGKKEGRKQRKKVVRLDLTTTVTVPGSRLEGNWRPAMSDQECGVVQIARLLQSQILS